MKTATYLYADDVRLFRVVRNTSDSLSLQRLVDVFSDWYNNNDLVISGDKCTSVYYNKFCIADMLQ